MPARARLSGLALVRSLCSKTIRPDRGRNSPMMHLRSVVLPTPLRPIRQTTSPGPTARSTSRTISVSPYATDSCSIRSIRFLVLSEINLDHPGVVLHLVDAPLAQQLALV